MQSKQNVELHPKEFYSYIRKKKVLTSAIGSLLTANGEHIEHQFVMANVLNDYFVSVFTEKNNSLNLPTPRMYDNNTHLNTCIFHANDILHAINILKINKTLGPDQISTKF